MLVGRWCGAMVAICAVLLGGRSARAEARYTIAYSGFAPLNDDVFVADADGGNARPLLASSGQDFNASFSRDGFSAPGR